MNPPNIKRPSGVNLKDTTSISCDKCKHEAFQEALLLREVSALLTGTGQVGLAPLQVFACVACGHVNNQFLPSELKEFISPIIR